MSEVETAVRATLPAHVIFVRYVLFAVMSGLSNLASQELVVRMLPLAPIMASVLFGTGVGFLVLFWAIELGSWHIWQTVEAKYIGAAIGLSLGHWIKYLLDKQYVFPRAMP